MIETFRAVSTALVGDADEGAEPDVDTCCTSAGSGAHIAFLTLNPVFQLAIAKAVEVPAGRIALVVLHAEPVKHIDGCPTPVAGAAPIAPYGETGPEAGVIVVVRLSDFHELSADRQDFGIDVVLSGAFEIEFWPATFILGCVQLRGSDRVVERFNIDRVGHGVGNWNADEGE
ncbi:hypothetical protein [Corynebacterium xerosis]|uniref:hypothetical protein n=1 Tax=Corynebacterium xerosis TaxID=1725 RepID=UPI001F09413F|nr:hypothetical protein [Corynebacterium xerosis]